MVRLARVVQGWRPDWPRNCKASPRSRTPVEVVATLTPHRADGVSRCATVGHVREDGTGPWLAQNWDWFLDAPERCVVVKAPEFVTFTEAGILAKIGVNTAGLALSLDILNHSSDRRAPVACPSTCCCRGARRVRHRRRCRDPAPQRRRVSVVVSHRGHRRRRRRDVRDHAGRSGATRRRPRRVPQPHQQLRGPDPRRRRRAFRSWSGVHPPRRSGALRPARSRKGRAALSSHAAEPVPVCRHGLPGPNGLPQRARRLPAPRPGCPQHRRGSWSAVPGGLRTLLSRPRSVTQRRGCRVRQVSWRDFALRRPDRGKHPHGQPEGPPRRGAVESAQVDAVVGAGDLAGEDLARR